MKMTTKELSFVADTFTVKSEIGLLANLQEQADGTEAESLRAKGLYQNGALTQPARDILEIAATAQKCCRLILKDSVFLMEKYTYAAGSQLALVENAGGELLFSQPENLSATMEQIAEFTGSAEIKTTGLELLLSREEVLLFLSMVDIYRKRALLDYVGLGYSQAAIPFSEIMQQLIAPASNSLVQLFKQNYNYPIPPVEKAQGILEQLKQKDCVAYTDGYVLTGESAIFAQNFLIPETVIMLDLFNLNDQKETIRVSGLWLCAGLRNIAAFFIYSDAIEISASSGSQLLQTMEYFLGCPDIRDTAPGAGF